MPVAVVHRAVRTHRALHEAVDVDKRKRPPGSPVKLPMKSSVASAFVETPQKRSPSWPSTRSVMETWRRRGAMPWAAGEALVGWNGDAPSTMLSPSTFQVPRRSGEAAAAVAPRTRQPAARPAQNVGRSGGASFVLPRKPSGAGSIGAGRLLEKCPRQTSHGRSRTVGACRTPPRRSTPASTSARRRALPAHRRPRHGAVDRAANERRVPERARDEPDRGAAGDPASQDAGEGAGRLSRATGGAQD